MYNFSKLNKVLLLLRKKLYYYYYYYYYCYCYYYLCESFRFAYWCYSRCQWLEIYCREKRPPGLINLVPMVLSSSPLRIEDE